MLRLALAFAVLLSVGGATAQAADPKLRKALDQWVSSYRRGKIDMRSWAAMGGGAVYLPPDSPQLRLQALLDAAATANTGRIALRVLVIAGSGLDRFDYRAEHAPVTVRMMATKALASLTGEEVAKAIRQTAQGVVLDKAPKKYLAAARAAALIALGVRDDAAARSILEGALRDADALIRLAGAAGLRELCAAESAAALIELLRSEDDEAVLIAVTRALARVLSEERDDLAGPGPGPGPGPGQGKDPGPTGPVPTTAAQQAAAKAVIGALGRKTWRADLELVAFLGSFPVAAAVPALIDQLARFVDHPELIASGELSGLLRSRVHATLVGCTGQAIPARRVDLWRVFWEREKVTFELVGQQEPGKGGSSRTVSTGFFGIPVEGTRVVFVIDVSGSMRDPFPRGTTAGGRGGKNVPTKMDVAKEELLRAVQSLPPEAHFEVVLFSQRVKRWRDKLMPANNSNKRALGRYLARVKPKTSTNLWGGVDKALNIKSLVRGDRYESNVDELFLLSDGSPTSGDIINSGEILRTLGETNRYSGVRINTVFLESPVAPAPGGGGRIGLPADIESDLSPAELMAELARVSGGRYVLPR